MYSSVTPQVKRPTAYGTVLMATSNPEKVGAVLEKIAEKPASSLAPLADEELQFDAATGELVAVRKGEKVVDRDRVPATQMAREGFFRGGS